MKIHHFVTCCVLFTAVLGFSILDVSAEYAKDSLPLETINQNSFADCNCENGNCVTNRRGQTKCVCKPGFALQEEFTCKPCDCGSLGKCMFVLTLDKSAPNGQYQYKKKCLCDVGKAEKDGVCVDCFCGINSVCDFDDDEKRCYCMDGYSEKDGVCTKCDCGSYGECEFENGNKKCECFEGYLELNGVCEECDCGDHGTCSFVNGQKTCNCGPRFSDNDGKCEQCDCGDNGTCSFVNGQKTCKCDPGFNVNDGKCETCDCGNHGNCSFVSGQQTCKCEPRFAVNNNGKCEQCDCGDNGTCSFINGQKTCRCYQGFSENDGKCNLCDCGSNSVNCTFVDGVKKCKCNDKYADRYGTCEECYCGENSESCNFKDNQKSCSCLEGYVQKGESCEPGCSVERPCLNGGYCKEGFCFCLNGTRGELCEEVDECSSLCPQNSDIECAYDTKSQKAFCKCLDSELSYDSIMKKCRKGCGTDDDCQNGAKCSLKGANKFCDCLPGTQGDRCETIDDCASGKIRCEGGSAYCGYDVNSRKATCKCKDENERYDPRHGRCRFFCKNNNCYNGGRCDNQGNCWCHCGTQGFRCEIVTACHYGHISCRGDNAYCGFDLRTLHATCFCKNPNEYYNFCYGRCMSKWRSDAKCAVQDYGLSISSKQCG